MKKKSSTRRIVLFQGSFDIINWGHIKCFELAKSYGDYLIVALNSNKLVQSYKGQRPVLPWQQKKFMIESCRYVDKVVRATEMSPQKLLERHNVDIYIVAEEWIRERENDIAFVKERGGQVFYTPRFPGVISSGEIKHRLLREYINGGSG